MILHVKDLTFGLEDGFRILNGITFSVDKGQTVGIIGPNGSGKTTLFNCLSGFVLANGGSVIFFDHDISRKPAHERARLGLGRVFQNSGIFRELTLLENILVALESKVHNSFALLPWGKRSGAREAQAMEYLKQVGLAARAKEKAACLSGGQMRLLEIVRTLACGAELFLLDEPTAGVSPKMKDDVAAIIAMLQNLEKTVLIIEHDMNFIQRFCQRILVLNEGQVIMDDTPEAVVHSPLLREIYFGIN